MSFVRTVLGDIPSKFLGATDSHEHLFIRDGLILVKEPAFRLDSEISAIKEVNDFKSFGGQAIVECSPAGVGRDPEGLAKVSRATGVHIIASTGLHKPYYYLDSHWRHHYTSDAMARLFVEELTVGMDVHGFEHPLSKKSSARAGVIKAASEYQQISSAAMVGFEAVSIAHTETGAPILTHTETGTMAMAQIELMQSYKVHPSSVILSHVDRNPDWMLHRDLAQAGAFLEYDGPGRVKYLPESTVIELIRKMFDLGLGSQVLLGGDTARRSSWKAYGGGPGIAYIMQQFIPRLRKEGFSEDQTEKLLIDNPARAFAIRKFDVHEER